MKFISALILVSAFAFTSAQLGVKGGVSSGSSGLRSNSFFPRLAPGSIQEKKEQLQFANVDDVFVGGGVSSTGAGFVQPVQTVQTFQPVQTVQTFQPVQTVQTVQPVQTVQTVQPVQPVQTVQTVAQPENVFTVVQQERPTQSVLVPSSGSVSSVGSVPVSTSVGPQSQVVPVRSNFGYFDDQNTEVFVDNPVGLAQPAPAVQTFQSFAPLRAFSNGFVFDNRQPVQQLVQYGAGQAVPSFPTTFAQNIAHFAPQPQVGTVQTVPTFTQTSFVPSSVSSGKVVKQVVAPAATSQPASFPSFSSFSVPSFQPSNGLVVPQAVDTGRRFVSANLPTSVPTSGQVTPTFSSKIFTDNRISSPAVGVAAQQQFPSVISQEKQSAETVQTTEW